MESGWKHSTEPDVLMRRLSPYSPHPHSLLPTVSVVVGGVKVWTDLIASSAFPKYVALYENLCLCRDSTQRSPLRDVLTRKDKNEPDPPK